jgi:CAAX protease family protein
MLRDRTGPTWALVLTAVNAVLLVPIVEEMLFRGILLPALAARTKSPRAGLLLSSIVFGLIHFGVGKSIPALMVFGLVLGAAYLRSRSLLLVILIHSLFNAKTILWLLLGGGG